MFRVAAAAACVFAFVAAPAEAAELFGGVFVHDVRSPLTKSGIEDGMDLQVGLRGDRIGRTPLQPYILASAHTAGQTHFAAVGLSAKFGDRFYIRPGLGVAVHTGDTGDFEDPGDDDIEFGSRILIEPELGIGFAIDDRSSIEASWVHLSHAQLLGGQNPGMDSFGLRFNLAF